MDLSDALTIVRRWLWLPLLVGAIGAGSAALVSSRLTPIYEATTAVLVRPAQTGTQTALLSVDQIASTYAQLMTKRPLLQQVIDELKLPYSADALQANVSIAPERDTELLDVKVRDADPGRAALIANTLIGDFIAQTTAEEESQINASLQGLQSRIDDLQQQMASNSRDIAQLRSKPRPTPDEQAQLADLEARQSADNAAYATLVKSYEDLRSSQLTRYETLQVVDPATPAARPVRPNILLNTLLAGALGVMLAVGLAFLLAALDNTLKSEEDVHRILNLPALGNLVYRKSGKEGELITLYEPGLPASEAFRTLRTNLLFSGVDRGLRTILVTSAGPGEGKTRTAANLAVALAQAGQRCVLVDADFRRSGLHQIFRQVDPRGLSDMILGGGLDPGLKQKTDLSTLTVVFAGTPPPNPSELLGSQRMERLVQQLSADADVVVFDTPPLNAVTDAALLAARLDATILVIEAGRTPRAAVLRAREAIARVRGSLVGVVLNKTKWQADRRYYYYHSPQRAGKPAPTSPTLPLHPERA